MTHRVNMLLQAIAITVIASVISLIMYSTWFRACCMDRLRVSLGIATLPAIFLAMFIGGGVHSATAVHYTIGLVAELLGIWGSFTLCVEFGQSASSDFIYLDRTMSGGSEARAFPSASWRP
jgi:hypothetical protein